MIGFIDDHRGAYGVEPICRVLPIAPSTYHDHVAKRVDPTKLSARAKRDQALRPEIGRVFKENFAVYGVRKVWRQLGREGTPVARCTVERLMADLGLQGAIRGKPVRTTISDKAAPCPLDHVNRQFHAPAPNLLWLSDFTYVSTWSGFVYVAFVIDAETGAHVWAEKYDRDLEDVFAVQDEIVETLVWRVAGHVTRVELERTKRQRTVSADAYDLFEPPRDCRRLFGLSHAARFCSPSIA